MNKKLKTMMKKPSFAAYRLTEDSRLEILGPNHKTVDNYFLFDGTHYYFGNPLVKLSSNSEKHCDMILAMTDTKLLLPQNEGSSLYIARNYPAHKDLVVVVLYYYDNYLYYSIVSGSGSGRVHPVYLPVSSQHFDFCFHLSISKPFLQYC